MINRACIKIKRVWIRPAASSLRTVCFGNEDIIQVVRHMWCQITLMGLGFITLSTSLSYVSAGHTHLSRPPIDSQPYIYVQVYCPDLLTPSPRWLYLVHGLFLFLYQVRTGSGCPHNHCPCKLCSLRFPQTFDAVDGKQARRTGSSSPLGELFDHGGDPHVALPPTRRMRITDCDSTAGCGRV